MPVASRFSQGYVHDSSLSFALRSLSCLQSEKWIIPRNPVVDVILSLKPLGWETPISIIPEFILRKFFYRDLEDIAPPPGSTGLFESTPMVNSDLLDLIREGKASWLRGDPVRFESKGVRFNHREQGQKKGAPGKEELIEGDIIIFATGFKRPSLKSFLPASCFEDNFAPPAWYLQCFPPGAPDICAINCTFVNAIGTVGHFHIGIYTRLLIMFLTDPLTIPSLKLMKLWINTFRLIKSTAPTGAFDYFTYFEMCFWFFTVLVVNPFRLKWAPFVVLGWGKWIPDVVVLMEDFVRKLFGMKTHKEAREEKDVLDAGGERLKFGGGSAGKVHK
jgi:hypothetical protein